MIKVRENYTVLPGSPDRIIDSHELLLIVPFSLRQITRMEKKSKFPGRVRLGLSRIGWVLSEVQEWIAARAAERRTFVPA
jgi:prophage regulatory protein